MTQGAFHPTCTFPDDLVRPARIDPTGVTGPTRGQAQRGRWRACAHGWYVPTVTDSTRVEQRILEQAVRLGPGGALTGWASLRWRGAAYFDGTAVDGAALRPVPLLRSAGGNLTRETAAAISRCQLAPSEIEIVHGVPCTTVQRALFDEMRFAVSLREAVVAADMTAAAGLITPGIMTVYVSHRPAWKGVPRVRRALLLCIVDSRSPQETRLRLVWILDARLPPPLCNRPVFDRSGNLLGYPDLLDPVAGVVGEYDGADHRTASRHRRDVTREAAFRDHGLEFFRVVGGDLGNRALVVDRMLSARRRARFLPEEDRAWTLVPPPWWEQPETLDHRLVRLGAVGALTST